MYSAYFLSRIPDHVTHTIQQSLPTSLKYKNHLSGVLVQAMAHIRPLLQNINTRRTEVDAVTHTHYRVCPGNMW